MQLPLKYIERNVLVRREAETDPKYGFNPQNRPIEELLQYGVVVLNKTQGPTSHQIVDYLKKILHIDKAGHSGTLDPNVTGVLVVPLSKVTRVVDVLLKAGKEYVCLMKIHKPIDEQTIRDTLQSFVGNIEQMPPVKSAVKRQLRTRQIYYLDILEIHGQEILFRVGCQAGTYIRKLCTDAGEKMGTKAHMQELVRTKVANFSQDDWITLHDLKDAYVAWKEDGNQQELRQCVKPIEIIAEQIPKIWVTDYTVDALCHGAFLSVPGISKLNDGINVGDTVAMMTLKGELIGFGVAKMNSQNMLRQEKGVAVGNPRIFMPRLTYPKYVKDEKSTSTD